MASCSQSLKNANVHDTEDHKQDEQPSAVKTNSVDLTKFTKMVAMSHKLYNSAAFKGKDDRSKRRKLLHRLRGLYEAANQNELFEQAVLNAGWTDFGEWLRDTNGIKLDSEVAQKVLYKLLDSHKNAKAMQWRFVDGAELKLDEQELKEVVDLTSELMKTYYDNSENLGPWNRAKMEQELTHNLSQCLILRDRSNRNALIGYVCYRIEQNVVSLEEDYLEFYVYELMIHPKYQRQRYGEYLMSVCEFIADAKECDYIELTVFTENIPALKFYRKQLNYEFDKNELDEYKHDYRILTKILT